MAYISGPSTQEGRWRQEDCKFQVVLCCLMNSCGEIEEFNAEVAEVTFYPHSSCIPLSPPFPGPRSSRSSGKDPSSLQHWNICFPVGEQSLAPPLYTAMPEFLTIQEPSLLVLQDFMSIAALIDHDYSLNGLLNKSSYVSICVFVHMYCARNRTQGLTCTLYHWATPPVTMEYSMYGY